MSATEVAVIRDWLRLAYAAVPGYLSAFALPDGTSAFFPTDKLDDAATYIARRAANANVYVGCAALANPPRTGRGSASDTIALVGLWCDLDIAGPGHKWGDESRRELRLPADRAEALSILDDLGLEPSAVIDSGHGLYGWWLFDEPIVFASDAERQAAANLSATFGRTLIEHGRRRGLHIDNVSDLARVLRAPGTVNRKTDPVPVRLVECHGDRRYMPADLRAVCVAPDPLCAATQKSAPRVHTHGGESPAEAFCRLVSWGEILEPAGFTCMFEHGDVGYWRHYAATSPAGTPSATTGAKNTPVLVVHSESAGAVTGLPVGGGHRLTKFRAWAILNHGGDESAAARSILDLARRSA
jgi:hypothetical protein